MNEKKGGEVTHEAWKPGFYAACIHQPPHPTGTPHFQGGESMQITTFWIPSLNRYYLALIIRVSVNLPSAFNISSFNWLPDVAALKTDLFELITTGKRTCGVASQFIVR